MNHTFIWTDLSSYHPIESAEFYKNVFDWKTYNESGYIMAYSMESEVCGIYETPDFFKKIKMPHFWMNYIEVSDLSIIVAKAKSMGARVELSNIPFYKGKIALIRDPMGAGFTIYEGAGLKQPNKTGHGCVLNRELHTSDASRIIPFYRDLFGWIITVEGNDSYTIFKDDKLVATMLGLSNKLKGQYEYWVTVFGVKDMIKSHRGIIASGGSLISDEGERKLYTDPWGEAFFYIQQCES